jgi:sec-independent protein translocase protein TatB
VSLGEIVLLLIVGIIVVGPRNLPTLMRTAGQWVARLRRMTTELRAQSGIDDVLRREGLDEHLHELRSLSRLNVVESLIAPVAAPAAPSPYTSPSPSANEAPPGTWGRGPNMGAGQPLREREYPLIGCDAYGALPDDVPSYRTMAAMHAAPKPAETAEDVPAGGAEGGAQASEVKGEAQASAEQPAEGAAT